MFLLDFNSYNIQFWAVEDGSKLKHLQDIIILTKLRFLAVL